MSNTSPENNSEPNLSWSKVKKFLTPDRIKQIIQAAIPYILIYAVFLFVMSKFEITEDSVRGFFAGQGAILAPVFVIIQFVVSLTPLPDLPFIAAGVLFFQPWATFGLIWLGMWLGTMVNFWIARKLGRSFIKRKYPETAEWIDRFSSSYGVETVIVARPFTFVTFDLIAYAAGISSMAFPKYAIASFIGIIPVALNATLVGLAITSHNILRGILLFAISGSLAIFLGMLAKLYRVRMERIAKVASRR